MSVGDEEYTAYGFFVTLNDSDLSYGYFVFAAHALGLYNRPESNSTLEYVYVQHPVSKVWAPVIDAIQVDGVSGVAMVKTGMSLVELKERVITLSTTTVEENDDCSLVVNDPITRLPKVISSTVIHGSFNDHSGSYIMPSIVIDIRCDTVTSGCPVLDASGRLIGMLLYYLPSDMGRACGANTETLRQTLLHLITRTTRLYLGLNWCNVPSTCVRSSRSVPEGVYIRSVDSRSPFAAILKQGYILTTFTVADKVHTLGTSTLCTSLGILCYVERQCIVGISFYDHHTNTLRVADVCLNVDYDDIDTDIPFHGGHLLAHATTRVIRLLS